MAQQVIIGNPLPIGNLTNYSWDAPILTQNDAFARAAQALISPDEFGYNASYPRPAPSSTPYSAAGAAGSSAAGTAGSATGATGTHKPVEPFLTPAEQQALDDLITRTNQQLIDTDYNYNVAAANAHEQAGQSPTDHTGLIYQQMVKDRANQNDELIARGLGMSSIRDGQLADLEATSTARRASLLNALALQAGHDAQTKNLLNEALNRAQANSKAQAVQNAMNITPTPDTAPTGTASGGQAANGQIAQGGGTQPTQPQGGGNVIHQPTGSSSYDPGEAILTPGSGYQQPGPTVVGAPAGGTIGAINLPPPQQYTITGDPFANAARSYAQNGSGVSIF